MESRSRSGPSPGIAAPRLDAEAELAAIYDRTVDDVYRFCLARSGDAEVAADTTAEVFFAAARAFAGGTGDSVTRAWLFTVAKNRLVDHWRRWGRQERRAERLAASARAITHAGDLGDEVAPIVAADVVDALQSLPERQRAALALRYLDELSVSEIADELEVTYQAAESLLARARRSFERAWQNQQLSTGRTKER